MTHKTSILIFTAVESKFQLSVVTNRKETFTFMWPCIAVNFFVIANQTH